MSQDLLNTYVIGFDRAIRETVEVKGGKLRPYVQLATGDLFRKEGVYQRTTGGGLPQKVTNRFGDSPVSELDYSRRRTSRQAFQDGQFMDWADLSKMGTDPRNAKLNAMKNKFMRQEDIILDQAFLGTANTTDVETSASTQAFRDNEAVSVDANADNNYDFTYKKFLSVLEKFGNNNVDIDSQAPVFKISWVQWKQMMEDDNFINFDYTANRPLDRSAGAIYDYMGAKFCISNIVPFINRTGAEIETLEASYSSTSTTLQAYFEIADTDLASTGAWQSASTDSTRACYAFMPDAALLEINPDMTTKVSERADKGFNYYAYMKAELGAVRMEEEKVVVIPCSNS